MQRTLDLAVLDEAIAQYRQRMGTDSRSGKNLIAQPVERDGRAVHIHAQDAVRVDFTGGCDPLPCHRLRPRTSCSA